MKTYLYFSILLIMLLSGCEKDHLDADTAKKLIAQYYNLPKIYDYAISTGDPEEARKLLGLGLERDGFVKIQRSQSFAQAGTPWISFTEKSKIYLLPTEQKDLKYHRQNVKIAIQEMGEVKSIVMGKENKAAIVEFTILNKSPTPFSKLLSNNWSGSRTLKAYFIKYDTGWELDNKQGELMPLGF